MTRLPLFLHDRHSPGPRTNKQIDCQLQKHPEKWIAGGEEPTSADFMMLFPAEAIGGGRADMPPPQSLKDYVERIHERCVGPRTTLRNRALIIIILPLYRPAYKKALEKGGKYKYANPKL
jgi:glutathione S-transferase